MYERSDSRSRQVSCGFRVNMVQGANLLVGGITAATQVRSMSCSIIVRLIERISRLLDYWRGNNH